MNERRRSQSSEGHGVITVGSEGGGGGAEGGSARERNTKLTARCAGSSTLGAGELGAGPQPGKQRCASVANPTQTYKHSRPNKWHKQFPSQ